MTFLIESHYNYCRTIFLDHVGLAFEFFNSFFHGDGVDDALALDALEPGLDDRPFRAVNHDRHARNVRCSGNQIQEPSHHRLGVEHALVHVHVDDLRTVLDLLPGDSQRFLVLVVLDQVRKARRTGDIRSLADIEEIGLRPNRQGLHAAEPQPRLRLGQVARLAVTDRRGDTADVIRRCATATADDV